MVYFSVAIGIAIFSDVIKMQTCEKKISAMVYIMAIYQVYE